MLNINKTSLKFYQKINREQGFKNAADLSDYLIWLFYGTISDSDLIPYLKIIYPNTLY